MHRKCEVEPSPALPTLAQPSQTQPSPAQPTCRHACRASAAHEAWRLWAAAAGGRLLSGIEPASGRAVTGMSWREFTRHARTRIGE